MRVNSNSAISGVPVLRVRKFFRRHRLIEWRPGALEEDLELTAAQAQALFAELIALRYIEPSTSDPSWYHITLAGAAFAGATAAKPLKRQSADQKLHEFLDRVRAVNSDPDFLYWIPKVILFGSYLSDKERISDIDIAVDMVRRVHGEEYMEALWRRVRDAEAGGRRFANYNDELSWPEVEVLKFLRNRARSISIVMADNPILKHATQTRVYEFPASAPGVRVDDAKAR